MPPKKKGFHRHHIIPKYNGGTDDDENIIYLTPEDHAKAHLELFERFGRYEDAQAYNSLKKHWLGSRTISGYKQSADHVIKRRASMNYESVSLKLRGRASPTKGLKFAYRAKPKIAEAQRGKARSEETKTKISKALKGNDPSNKIEFYCICCRTRVPPSRIDRHGYGKRICTPMP